VDGSRYNDKLEEPNLNQSINRSNNPKEGDQGPNQGT
jgi:hypothetical protein